MIERLLIKALALALPEDALNATDPVQIPGWYETSLPDSPGLFSPSFLQNDLQAINKFHVGMLSISFMVGLGYGGFTAYSCWVEENIFLSYIRNLVIALTCKTFFSLLFEAVIALGNPLNVGGSNALMAFENISLSLVIAFWLLLTTYLHARMSRNFNNEPSLTMSQMAIPGIAVYFSFVWIFVMEGSYSNQLWWLIDYFVPAIQWITNSLRLLYLFMQLALLVDIGRLTMNKSSLDNDTISLLRKISALMVVLVFLFWLHFGLSVGRPASNPKSYYYFYFFIDGIFLVAVCPIFFFLDRWVPSVLDKISDVLTTDGQRTANPENSVDGLGRRGSIVTIDSILAREGHREWPVHSSEDVVYSSVVHPHKLKSTFDLYKRLNATSVVVDGEEFFNCGSQRSARSARSSVQSRSQKKNAFYSSKYLIVEPKKEELPKYLETRGSVSPADAGTPGEGSVERWLEDCPEEAGKAQEVQPKTETSRNLSRETSEEKRKLEESDKPVPKRRKKYLE